MDLAAWTQDPDEEGNLSLVEITDEIHDLISKAPIVTAEPRTKLDKRNWRIPTSPDDDRDVELRHRVPAKFSVRWPHKNQEHFFYDNPQWEDFDLTYDGFIYTITAHIKAVPDGNATFDFGREGHRILTNILGESEKWKLEFVGPCPMWPVFYVAFAAEPDKFSFGRELCQDFNSWECLYVQSKEAGVSLDDVLSSIRMPATLSYDALLERNRFIDHQAELYESFENASQGYRQSLDPMSIDPRTWLFRMSATRELARDLSKAYAEYTQVEEARASMVTAVRRASEAFEKNPLLKDKAAYTGEMVREDVAWEGTHVLETLRFLADESRNRGIQFATYAGPLIGALIGAGAVGLGFWLGG
ncbi:MAG: hypothetical protein IIC91_10450 [Chloroflexi bacterium]|nr:hypothetical protein [Chloroflexota bacterium]